MCFLLRSCLLTVTIEIDTVLVRATSVECEVDGIADDRDGINVVDDSENFTSGDNFRVRVFDRRDDTCMRLQLLENESD